MNERMLAWALNRLLAWALRPVAVPNGNRLGRLRPSGPIGIRARTMTPRLSRSACSPSIAGWAPYIIRNASPSSCSAPESSRGQYGDAGGDQPLLEPPAPEFAFGRIDRISRCPGWDRTARSARRSPPSCSPAPDSTAACRSACPGPEFGRRSWRCIRSSA